MATAASLSALPATSHIMLPTTPPSKLSFATISNKLLVGASAGIIGTGLIYPIDVIKTKIQSHSSHLSARSFSAFIRQLVSSGGFYRGFSACLVGIAPEKAIKLAANDVIRDSFTHGARPIKVREELLAGTSAGFLQLAVTVPYEGIKIKLQTSTSNISGWQILRSMRGLSELYRGFTATFYRDVPFCFLFFPLYSNIKSYQMDHIYRINSSSSSKEIAEPFHVGLVAGILAGAISAVTVTPADMLKTRIQQGFNGEKGFFEYAKHVVKTEGTGALYKGWQARMLVIAPLYGIVSLAFEIQKRWMGL